MKKLTFLIIISLFAFSCNNKKDDPQPGSNGTTTPPTTTNTPPTVSANPSSANNPTTITINASDADGTISKVEVFNGSTLLTTLTTSPYIYTLPTLANGSYTYTIKATDNSNAVSSTTVSFTVSTTATPKADTETILNGFMNVALSKAGGNGQFIGTLTITSTSLTASQAQNTFFGATTANGTYIVNDSGYLILTSSGIQTTYSVSTGTKSGNPTLILTNVNDASELYIFQSNSTPQQNTIAILSSFSGRALQGLRGNTTISATAFTTTATQFSGDFFTGAASAGTYNYTVLSNGNIQFVVGAYTIEYSVQVSSGYLVLTNVADGSKIYTLY